MFDHDIPVTKDHEKLSVLYLRDLPHEVHADDVKDFFSAYGTVLVMERLKNADFPLLFDGNRVIKMILEKDLPYFLTVFGFECRLWYRDQPIQCFLCREHGHRAQSCPLSGRCRRCRQPGHVARECRQAWDSVSRVDPPNVPESDSVPDPEELPSVDKPPVDKSPVDVPPAVDPVLPVDVPPVDPVLPVDKLPVDKSLVDVPPVAVDPVLPVAVPPSVPVDVVPVDDVPVINDSSVSEPAASETASLKDDAQSSASASSGSNSNVLGLNGVELFRQNLAQPRGDTSLHWDIWDRATENLAYAVSKINRDSFLKLSSDGLEKFIVNALVSKRMARNSNLRFLLKLSLSKLQKVLRNT